MTSAGKRYLTNTDQTKQMTLEELEKKVQITELEKKLLDAFTNKDLPVIDELLHDHSLFIYPNGQTLTKTLVLENYRSGNSDFTSAISSDQRINLIEDIAIVSITLELKGKYFDQKINSQFQYLRVWKLFNENWKVIAVCGVPISK